MIKVNSYFTFLHSIVVYIPSYLIYPYIKHLFADYFRVTTCVLFLSVSKYNLGVSVKLLRDFGRPMGTHG